jgi:hypothetical protein
MEEQGMRVDRWLPRSGRWKVHAAATGVFLSLASPGWPQIAGENVNMVSGTQWPGGDPFLQRDNEPSMAVSSLNVERLLAGGNTYRTVDIPFPPGGDTETGDAWLGLWKSFDAGRTWKTYLLPGYPQDTSPEGRASPLQQRGLRAAADPTVRAGTDGFFLVSGIAFNRQTDASAVFVSRHVDLGIKENGDATLGRDSMPYLDTIVVDDGHAGQFLDKPWVAIDIPRPFAQGTCTISLPADHPVFPGVTRTFPVGPMYIAWTRFTGDHSTKVLLARSLDCGKTWSQPTKLSESSNVNQGATIAIDPQTGTVYVAWRRFATASQSDAILVASSGDGQGFGKAVEIVSFLPFDQGTTGYAFRTNALPTMAVSVAGGVSRIHVAWAQRGATGGDARVAVATSADGGSTWSPPAMVDDGPANDEFGAPYTTDDGQALTRGHQIMPQMTFSGGKLVVLYYDLRLDHTSGVFAPNDPFEPDAESGRYYSETREKVGELASPPDTPEAVYRPYIADAPPTPTEPGITIRRHTIDVRVAQAEPDTLSWRSSPVSRYPFGTVDGEAGTPTTLRQLGTNPPNLPLFRQGTVPFMGDYIDIAGETFLPPATAGGAWRYNLDRQSAPVFYATWTSNQDVRPPADGDWTHYTPAIYPPRPSLVDPSQTTQTCVPGQEGMRNQNIYMSRISQGLLVSSPQNAKPLSQTVERAFVVVAENTTLLEKAFRLSIADQPPGGRASFLPVTSIANGAALCLASVAAQGSTSCTALDVKIPPGSGIARSVFVTSSDPAARISVGVDEIAALGAPGPLGGGLSGYVLLNANPVTVLANPDGAATDIATEEVYDPTIALVSVSSPNVSNPNVSNPNVSNPNVSNPNVSNPNVSNPNVSNQTISDANYTITNTGNTTHSYHVQLVGTAPGATPLQLILSRPYATPTADACQLGVENRNETIASIADAQVVAPSRAADPAIPDPEAGNATLSLAPGESAIITVRGAVDAAGMQEILSQVAPSVVTHGRTEAKQPFAAPLLITSSSGPDTAATVGVPFRLPLQSLGGRGTITWSSSGPLPPGLLGGGGLVSGTPTGAGSFVAAVTATDSSSPAQTTTRSLSFTVSRRSTAVTLDFPGHGEAMGERRRVRVTVTDTDEGTKSAPAGTITVTGDPGLSGGSCTLDPEDSGSSCAVFVSVSAPGRYGFSASYSPASSPAVHAASTASAVLTRPGRPAIEPDDLDDLPSGGDVE